ncbi:MAG: Cytidine monophosphate kinase [Candidatus Phytoplasma pruni]|nr:Cytidine monophosphate kinase [Candidatus Phytoplasma pruni]
MSYWGEYFHNSSTQRKIIKKRGECYNMLSFRLAIDGPAGSGKSTISQLLSDKFGWFYLNTGVLFRILTYYILKNKVPYKTPEDQKILAKRLEETHIKLADNIFYLNNEDLTFRLKDKEIEKEISFISSLAVVRNKIFNLQQKLIQQHPFIIMDGRDIGTVVMPEANLKIFLTASAQKRALRKQKELFAKKQKNISLESIVESIEARDKQDIERELAPLKKAEDALFLDTTDMSIDEVVQFIEAKIMEKL